MRSRWNLILTMALISAGCSSRQHSSTTPQTTSRPTVTVTRTSPRPTAPVVLDWRAVPPDRLEMQAVSTCTATGDATLPDGQIVTTQHCVGATTMPADFHVAEGWPRAGTQSIADMIAAGDTAKLWLDGARQSSPGYFSNDATGQTVAYSAWEFRAMGGTHVIEVVWYRQGIPVVTTTVTVTVGNGENGDGDAALPAGEIVYVDDVDGDGEIYTMNLATRAVTRLTDNDSDDISPAWSSDGNRIAFISDRTGGIEVFTMTADGSNVTQITHDDIAQLSPSWSPDGTYLAWIEDEKVLFYSADDLAFLGEFDPRGVDAGWPAVAVSLGTAGSALITAAISSQAALYDVTRFEGEPFQVDAWGRVLPTIGVVGSGRYSPDRSRIALLYAYGADDQARIGIVDRDDPDTMIDIGDPAMNRYYPAWSPDGEWVIYSASTDNVATFETPSYLDLCITRVSDGETIWVTQNRSGHLIEASFRPLVGDV